MYPYDYSRENYSRLGYVAEGVTTYYGDLFLARGGVYSIEEYFEELNVRLNKHLHNNGRFSMPVTQASFDTWLDGYVAGIPGRKTSIYDEGCLIALMTDLLVRKHSGNKHSLADVMRYLYQEFSKKNKGYSEQDYINAVELMAAQSFSDFFANYVYGTFDYLPLLQETLGFAGCAIIKDSAKNYHESVWGFKIIADNGKAKVANIASGSPAEKAGLAIEDELMSINNYRIDATNLSNWSEYFAKENVQLVISKGQHVMVVTIQPDGREYFSQYKVVAQKEKNSEQEVFFKNWIR